VSANDTPNNAVRRVRELTLTEWGGAGVGRPAERRPSIDEEGDGVELVVGERPRGTFSRQLFLAETLDSERIAADYTDGVLRLRIPVREQAKPRRVDISVGRDQSTPIEATSSDEAHEPAGATAS
jgi:hypothetical protein